jgi:hypothetical protein
MTSKSDAGGARTFSVDTRFQQMARRPGGVPRTRALQNAQTEIAQDKSTLDSWLDAEIDAIAGLLEAARAGTAGADWPERMGKRAGPMRDVGTTVGYPLLTFVAANLCDILQRPDAAAPSSLDAIACHVDSLFLARRREYRNLRPEQLPELSRGLHRISGSGNGGGA